MSAGRQVDTLSLRCGRGQRGGSGRSRAVTTELVTAGFGPGRALPAFKGGA